MRRSLLILRVSVVVAILSIALAVSAEHSSSTQLLTSNPTGRDLEAPSGLTVSLTEVDGVSTNTVGTDKIAQSWWGISPWPDDQFTPNLVTQSPFAWWLTTWDAKQSPSEIADCPLTATRQVEMRCDKGSITFTFSRPVTDPVFSITNVGASATSDDGEWANQRLRKHGWGIWTLDLANSDYIGTADLTMLSHIGDFAVVDDGAAYHLPGSDSRLDGAPAITRSSDPTQFNTFYTQEEGGFGSGSVQLSGTWTSVTFNRDLLWIYDTASATHNPTPGASFPHQGQNECILDQLPGTVLACILQGSVWTPTGADITNSVVAGVTYMNPMPEGSGWSISFEEDFGNAPASYDAADGASHLLSDLRIGSLVDAAGGESSLSPASEANNAGVSGIVSPNAGGTDTGNDAFGTDPEIPFSGDFTIDVPISGASDDGTVCGYLDIDGDGTFGSTAPEQQCADFVAGDTSVTLTWPEADVASIEADTAWLRIRASYDSAGVASPLGRLDSGEVEDWQVTVVQVEPTSTTTSTTTTSTTTVPVDPEVTEPEADVVTPQYTG